MKEAEFRKQSFWHDTLPEPLEEWPRLDRDLDVDVVIVGGGFTGLWSAYYLSEHAPELRIAVLEAERVAFGASGRNGGWCIGTMAGMSAHAHDPDGSTRLQRALFDTVSVVGDVCLKEGIDCDWHPGGWLSLAFSKTQETLQKSLVEAWRKQGFGLSDVCWLSREEALTRIHTPNHGAVFSPHCAVMHPARLTRGLAGVVSRRGVRIYEQSRVREIRAGGVDLDGMQVRANWVIRATEAYTDSIHSQRRVLIPMHSSVIATEPLSADLWEEIGLPNRETFGDCRRMVIYGQRTADDRMVFGHRGSYFFGSGIRNRFEADHGCFRRVEGILHQLFPSLAKVPISHRWAGALGIPRNFRPTVGFDRKRGFGFAGGYVGEGVAASNLAGRILADLCLGRATDLVDLPIVGGDFPRWEPEPLRWLGVNGVYRLGQALDSAELADRRGFGTAERVFSAFVKG